MIDPKTMPRDTDGELARAVSTLKKIRKLLTDADLPNEWQTWLAQQVAADYAPEGATP